MTSEALIWLLAGLLIFNVVVLFTVNLFLIRSRRQIKRLRARLDETRRPIGHRAVQAVMTTAARVREQGLVSGLVMGSLEDLTRFVLEDRREIEKVIASDGTATILFSDIESSTALNDEIGDKDWMDVLSSHDALVRAQVGRFGGHVVKSQGDGFMVVFRNPADAVRAGLGIQRGLAATRSRRLRRTPIRVRIGIHTGPVITKERDYFGRNVAMAARVAATAEGGELLVSQDVHDLLEATEEFRFEEYYEVELKGLAGIHTLWIVAGLSESQGK